MRAEMQTLCTSPPNLSNCTPHCSSSFSTRSWTETDSLSLSLSLTDTNSRGLLLACHTC